MVSLSQSARLNELCMYSITVETVTVGFEQTSYSASEDGPLNVQVCAVISNLLGDLECNLVVTFNAVSNNKSGKVYGLLSSNVKWQPQSKVL